MDITSLLDSALYLATLGYRVFPCVPNEKNPLTPRGCHDATDDLETIRQWWARWPNANIGVATNGLLVLDVDGFENPWLTHDRIEMLRETGPMTSRTARSGYHYWHAATVPTPCSVGRVAPKVDVRGDGGYVIAPPSIVGGLPYKWATEIDPCDDLPKSPDWLTELALGKSEPRPVARERVDIAAPGNMIPNGQRNATLTSIAGHLRRIGMGEIEIKSSLLATNRCRCNPPLDEREVAKIAWSVARYEPDQTSVAVVEHWHEQDIAESPRGVGAADPGPFPEELLQVPGFIGELMEHNLATAIKPQPILALASAISLQATLAGRKVCDSRGNRTNLYIVSITESGGGKGRGLKLNRDLLAEAGLDRLLGGSDIASDAGLISAVSNQPSILFQLDEMGRMLSAIADPKKSPSHLFKIPQTLMSLYSEADGLFRGKSYADSKRDIEIHQPCVNVMGYTAPEWFYKSLTPEMLLDGFVARLLIFDAKEIVKRRFQETVPLPESLIAQARWWAAYQPPGNLQNERPNPTVVRYTKEAIDVFNELGEFCDGQIEYRSLWARVEEKACRLALCYAISRDVNKPIIDRDAAIWAGALSHYLTDRLIYDLRLHIAESDYERKKNKILLAIRGSKGPVTAYQLTQKTRWATTKERTEILFDLMESGEITKKQEQTSGRPRDVYEARE